MPCAFTRRDLLVGAPLALALAACGKKNTASKSAVLLRGNGPDPDSLDPHKARSAESMVVLRDLFECLTRLDPNAAPAPGAAASWSVSDDGCIYTFKLREKLRWSNGDTVVAEGEAMLLAPARPKG
jgi:ABC-type oligopeptide transport system substrate-binding subunit